MVKANRKRPKIRRKLQSCKVNVRPMMSEMKSRWNLVSADGGENHRIGGSVIRPGFRSKVPRCICMATGPESGHGYSTLRGSARAMAVMDGKLYASACMMTTINTQHFGRAVLS